MLIKKTSRFTILGLVLLFAIGMVSSVPATGQGFNTIDVPGAFFTQANGINPEGDIVGAYGNPSNFHGFLLSKGTFTTIDFPGAASTSAAGINPRGDIVGFYFNPGPHGFLLRGAFTTIDFPGAATGILGINPRGDIVGFYDNAIGQHGLLLSK